MTVKYQSYSEYKKTGVKWLPAIPKDWHILPLKFASANKVKDGPHETPNFINDGIPFFSVDGIQNNRLVFEGCRFISDEDHQRYSQKCLPRHGDVLLGKAASVGKVAFVDTRKEFNVWSPLAVITPKSNHLGKFIYYSLQSVWLQSQCDVNSNSNTQKNLSMGDIDNLSFAIPSDEIATKIVNFLDHETAKIDILIEKQQQLIKLLKEKRQAVISHAVTKGLNPNAPMRDSGVEWLGEVPEHWGFSSLKHYSWILDCKHITAEFYDGGFPLASISEVKEWNVNLVTAKFTNEKFYKDLIEGGRKPQPGDIIYSRNATVGEAALVADNMPEFAMGQDVCMIRSKQEFLPEYLLFILKSGVIKNQLDLAMVGSTFKRINVDNIRNFSISLPPYEEQIQIVEELKRALGKYDALVLKAEATIGLMQERRIALISAAVTGKIDVRNWQSP